MARLEQELNHYLFFEFGVEGDESEVSESWPFTLQGVGEFDQSQIFRFDDDGDQFFALGGPVLDFLPVSGMTVGDLILQMRGSAWISHRDPVDVSMSVIGDPLIPSSRERRARLQTMAEEAVSSAAVTVLEGLFLKRTQEYLGLAQKEGSPNAVVFGLPRAGPAVLLPKASSWRRLAWGVGQWLHQTE